MEHSRKQKRKKEGEKTGAGVSLANNAAIGGLCGLVLCFALLFFASWLLVTGKLPQSSMAMVVIGVFFLSSFAGASYAIRRQKEKSLIVGLLQGGILYALTFVVGAFAERANLVGELSLTLLLAALLGGVVASFVPTKRKRKRA